MSLIYRCVCICVYCACVVCMFVGYVKVSTSDYFHFVTLQTISRQVAVGGRQ